MAEKHDLFRTGADLPDSIARVVDARAEAALAHARDEPLDGFAFAA